MIFNRFGSGLAVMLILLLCSCLNRPKVIGIQPLGEVDKVHCDSLREALSAIYNLRIVLLPSLKIPSDAFINVKSPRFRADSLIAFLREIQPDSIDYTVGIIAKDISTTKKDIRGNVKEPKARYNDWGIFGLGYRPGPSCIVSTFRLKKGNNGQFFSRLKKVGVHELGHNLGLKHCPNKDCVMQDAAETIATVDAVKLNLCSECKIKVGL